MLVFLHMLSVITSVALPFLFVFLLTYAVKLLMKDSFYYVLCAAAAGLCLLLMLYGVPTPHIL